MFRRLRRLARRSRIGFQGLGLRATRMSVVTTTRLTYLRCRAVDAVASLQLGIHCRIRLSLALLAPTLAHETLLHATFEVGPVVEILLVIYSYARLLQTLVLVEAVDGLRESAQLEVAAAVDEPREASPKMFDILPLAAILLSTR